MTSGPALPPERSDSESPQESLRPDDPTPIDEDSGNLRFAMRPGGPRTSDIAPSLDKSGPLPTKLLNMGIEAMFRAFFPYQYLDAQRAVVPIDPEYEPRLVERMRALATTVGSPEFPEMLRESILRDLYAENPHGFGYLPTVPEAAAISDRTDLALGDEARARIEETFQLRDKVLIPDISQIPIIGKIIPYKGKVTQYREVDVGEELEKAGSVTEKALVLVLALRHGLLHQDLAVDALLKVTSEMSQSGLYREAVSLLDMAMERGPVWWSSRVCVLVDQMAKIHFAGDDFVRAEMKFEEVARHGRFVDNSRPFNFHHGILKLAGGDIGRARWFLEKAAVGFRSAEEQRDFREAAAQLFGGMKDHRTAGRLILPELAE